MGFDNRTSRRELLRHFGAATGLAAASALSACGVQGAAGSPGLPAWLSAVEAQHSVRELADRVRGPVLVPGGQGYDAECAGFNQSVQHLPALIVGATDVADVRAAVEFAASHNLPVAVQTTGHGPSVPADGALLINTRRMTGVRVDPVTRTARVAAGVRWEQVIREAAAYGLAPLNGSSHLVGVVGYTLGGGIGPLARAYGYAADRVREIEVVTADGQLRRASEEQHPDLFWALRGGKGNFGVVTSMEFDLVPVGRLYGGGLFFPSERAAEVLHAYREWTRSMPEAMTSSAALIRFPLLPEIPAPLRGRFAVHVRIAFLGAPDEGELLVRSLRAVAPRIVDTVADMPYTDVASIHSDPTEPLPAYERSLMLAEFGSDTVDTLIKLAGPDSDGSLMMVEVRHLGGALSRPPSVPNAVGNRDAEYLVFALTAAPPDQAGKATAEIDQLINAMTPWGTGQSYLNFMGGLDASRERTRRAYDPGSYERLTAIKTTYDPQNRFRINHNIPPRPGTGG
ncbi:FAD-binding oxidoreductase [Pseudonocardia sp. DSM 110487]|uniref:FAD-binding oxidoreductase n=1 Tax=Pseudonocardia sp. DSM 110487 TaxID=2865833 RepID=UPI0021026594|nr:FAD-binding oxidoreductase [Pseudonocardia sp. DSM 110487]